MLAYPLLKLLNTPDSMDYETAMNITVMLNNYLSGLSLREITPQIITDIMVQAGSQSGNVKLILDAVVELLEHGESNPDIFTSGAKNIFRYPELTGGDKASELISTLEEKKELGTAIGQLSERGSKQDIQVFIGDEVPVDSMKDCSVVTATYSLGEGVQGKIGIIGPKRMNYQKVVDTLKDTMNQLDQVFAKPEE